MYFIIITITFISISVFFFFIFPRYWKYTREPSDCNVLSFTCLSNKDYDEKK